MQQTPINIQPRPDDNEVRCSSPTPDPQGSTSATAQVIRAKKYNPTSWIHDYDMDGKCSKDIIVEWMLEGKNWELYTGSRKQKPGETKNQTTLANELRQVLINKGHIDRNEKSIKETIRYFKTTFKATYDTIHSTGFGIDPATDGNITVRGMKTK